MPPYYCAFHILSGEYVYCHDMPFLSSLGYRCFLLPLGSTFDYDSSTKMLRELSREAVHDRLVLELTNPCLMYANRCIEEFEIHEFTEKLVPLHHRWREYYRNGSIKPLHERARH